MVNESVKTKKNYLIRNGILTGRLHSRETEKKINEMPTSNSRSINYRFKHSVRMNNT